VYILYGSYTINGIYWQVLKSYFVEQFTSFVSYVVFCFNNVFSLSFSPERCKNTGKGIYHISVTMQDFITRVPKHFFCKEYFGLRLSFWK